MKNPYLFDEIKLYVINNFQIISNAFKVIMENEIIIKDDNNKLNKNGEIFLCDTLQELEKIQQIYNNNLIN